MDQEIVGLTSPRTRHCRIAKRTSISEKDSGAAPAAHVWGSCHRLAIAAALPTQPPHAMDSIVNFVSVVHLINHEAVGDELVKLKPP